MGPGKVVVVVYWTVLGASWLVFLGVCASRALRRPDGPDRGWAWRLGELRWSTTEVLMIPSAIYFGFDAVFPLLRWCYEPQAAATRDDIVHLVLQMVMGPMLLLCTSLVITMGARLRTA